MKSVRTDLRVNQVWVAPQQNTEMVVKPIEERLNDLHNGLRRDARAGLWLNHKPNQPRYRCQEIGGVNSYLVLFNGSTREQVLKVAEGFGFCLVQEPELVSNTVVHALVGVTA